VKHKLEAITANRKSQAQPIQRLIDPLVSVHICVPHNGVSWKSEPAPLELTLDFGVVQDIGVVRLLGTTEPSFIRRYSWYEGDLTVTAVCSDDNFEKDIRPIKSAAVFKDYMFPRAQYSWTGRVPELVLPIESRARYVRLSITSRTGEIPLQKLEVESQKRQEDLESELLAADLNGDGVDELLVKTLRNEVTAVSADGKKLWSHSFPAEISTWNALDVDSSGRHQVVVYTAEDACYAFDATGKQLWRVDLWELSKRGATSGQLTGAPAPKITGERLPDMVWQRQYSQYLMYSLAAWKPDEKGRKEIVGWCKTPNYGLTIKPDLTVATDVRLASEQFALPDTKLLGREVLLLVGTSLTIKDTNDHNLLVRQMMGRSSANDDTPAFFGGAVVNDATLKGYLAINASSIEWAPVEAGGKFGPGWGEFSTVPITAYLVQDLDGDGVTDLALGYLDGFIRIYRISDGALVRKVCVGSPITGLAKLGKHLVVAARRGVRLYNAALQEQGSLNIRAVSAAGVKSSKPMVTVADENGVVWALTDAVK